MRRVAYAVTAPHEVTGRYHRSVYGDAALGDGHLIVRPGMRSELVAKHVKEGPFRTSAPWREF